MAYIKYNANPYNNDTIDCVVRGISKLMDISWDEAYIRLFVEGYIKKEIPIRNDVWIDFLLSEGYQIESVPNICPNCITVEEFANDHPQGRYLIGTGSHVIAVVHGNFYDTFNSGKERVLYYLKKGENKVA